MWLWIHLNSEFEENWEPSYPVRGTDNNHSTIFVLPSGLKTIHRLWSELKLELIMIKMTLYSTRLQKPVELKCVSVQ